MAFSLGARATSSASGLINSTELANSCVNLPGNKSALDGSGLQNNGQEFTI